MTMAILTRGSLGDVTQIEMILFLVVLPKGTEAIIITPVIDICAVTKAVFPLNFAKAKFCHIPPSHKNATDSGSTDVYGVNGNTCQGFIE